ncbi:hypothetical protein GGER_35010 [Serratia rubidaea]
MRPLAVIGHQHQPGGINIQASGGMQLIGDRLVEEIQHRRMVRIVGGAHIALRLVQHEVARPVDLFQHVAVKRDFHLRGQLQRPAFYRFAVNHDALRAEFTRHQRTADT